MRISDIIAYLGKDRQDAQELGLFETSPKYYEGKIGLPIPRLLTT